LHVQAFSIKILCITALCRLYVDLSRQQ